MSGLQSDSAKSGISRLRGGAGDLNESPSELFTYNNIHNIDLLCHVSIVGKGSRKKITVFFSGPAFFLSGQALLVAGSLKKTVFFAASLME